MIIFPVGGSWKEAELIAHLFPSLPSRRRIEIVTKLILKLDCWCFSRIKIHKDEPLRGNMRVNPEQRMLLWIEIVQTTVLFRVMQLPVW